MATKFRQKLEEEKRKKEALEQASADVDWVLESMQAFNPRVHTLNPKTFFVWREALQNASQTLKKELE